MSKYMPSKPKVYLQSRNEEKEEEKEE